MALKNRLSISDVFYFGPKLLKRTFCLTEYSCFQLEISKVLVSKVQYNLIAKNLFENNHEHIYFISFNIFLIIES